MNNLFQDRLRELEECATATSQLDELSGTKMAGYVAKATAAARDHKLNADSAYADGQDQEAHDEWKKEHKRANGVRAAIRKIKQRNESLIEGVNDDDYYIVHHSNKKIVDRISSKNAGVRFGTDLASHFKSHIAAADKKHGTGHSAIKGMDLKHKEGYKSVIEGVEQIEELSKDTLKSYRDEAKERRKEHNSAIQRLDHMSSMDGDEDGRMKKGIDYHKDQYNKRGKGMAKALSKIKKIREELAQLDELDKSTLASYYTKAIKNRHSKEMAMDSAKRRGDAEDTEKLGDKVANRSSGIEKAKRKFFTEAVKIGSKVKIHAPGKDYHEKVGHVGEIRHGAYAGAPKTYTVDYDGRSIQLPKKNVKLHSESVTEKTLTHAELKKREEVAHAMERDKPGIDKSKKMAIATAVAKRVEESIRIDELSKETIKSYAKKATRGLNSAARHAFDAGVTMASDEKKSDKAFSKASKRSKGVEKAIDRLTKEDVTHPSN
jgi:hypothetical protein